MKRNAFVMKLKPGHAEEYKKRHDEIWPDLTLLLSESGISEYSIFLDERTNTLFAVQKLAEGFDPEQIPSHPIVKKWWAYMADIMDVNQDNSPVEFQLKEVFHLP
ncbi:MULTISPECIES: L-rhamnose mutarotase [Flavobacteriaceae]|uniref:L-rhamnose mutarotase n=1 Tax=Flavobacteriaceae TaxID=49546 RepID=UPI0014922D99|nr:MULTISPECIES: L-rhamnose mutarotase [Allomuricauda]MDC6367633.1 L-rhamnose mutarotase [Muricauda sp. AC10]